MDDKRRILFGGWAPLRRALRRGRGALLALALAILAACLPSVSGQLHPPPDSPEACHPSALNGLSPLDGLLQIDACREQWLHTGIAPEGRPNVLRPLKMSAVPLHPMNRPATGAYTMTVVGASLGYSDMTARIRVGYTACEATTWIAYTALNCKVAAGAKSTRFIEGAVLVTIAGHSVANAMTGVFTYDQPTMSTVGLTNGAAFRGAVVTVTGKNMATYDSSPTARLEGTACETTPWISDTTVSCKPSASLSSTSRMVLTLGFSIGTLTKVFTFDAPSVLGGTWDVKDGWSGYTLTSLPENACPTGSGTTFVPGMIYGCDGKWGANLSIPAASTEVCGAGFVVCPSALAVQRLGLNASVCTSAPREGTFYATGESASAAGVCASDGMDGKVSLS